MYTNTKLWTIALSALSIININYSRPVREVGQLPVHLTSVPPVAAAVLFILCLFRYALCSHVDSYKHLRRLSRIQSIHHEKFKQFSFQSALNSLSLSHLSWFEALFNPHLLILELISIPETLFPVFPRMRSCFSLLRRLESLSCW